MAKNTDLRKLLVLHGPSLESGGILEALQEHFDVRVARELEDALAAMREGRFDAVLAETGDFLPLERGIVSQQAAVVLDRIGDGVCIVGSKGELVWANHPMEGFPAAVLEALCRLCAKAYEQFASDTAQRGKRFSLMPEDGTYYEVICSPVCDSQGLLRQIAAVVVDTTSQRRQQLKLNAIERAGRELVRLEEESFAQLNAAERLKLLEDRIIRCSKEVLDYQNFAVMVLDKQTNRLELLVWEGLAPQAAQQDFFASPDGNGICGYVASTGQSYICPDVTKDSRYIPGLAGAKSSLTGPLRLHDKVVGVLNVESDRIGAFREEDRQFAEIFGNYVALALHILNLLATERQSTHTQISGSICADLAGPLVDIITEATELKEDYIGHDDLRKRLDVLIDHATRARQTVHDLGQSAQTGLLSISGKTVEYDPILADKRVLVVDDEDLIRETISDVLRPYGCKVDTAADGDQAKEMIQRSSYDLVISDIKMPGTSGYEVFAAARDANETTEVILITAFGYDPSHSIIRAGEGGLAAVIFKPFKVQQLLETCREALLRRQE